MTLAVVAATIVVLALDVTDPAAAVFGAVTALLIGGVLDPDEALSGFSNAAPITIAALYVIAAGIERTGVLNRLVDVVIGRPAGERTTLTRLAVPAAGASAFLNNTPIVAMVSPAVARWSQRAGRAASQLLMPLSFAAILGGMLTVIGTSTNIVVSGLLEEAGRDAFGFFEVAKLGLPLAVVGLVLIVMTAPTLLPERLATRDDVADSREFTVEMTVVPGGAIDGMNVADAGLRHLIGVFLVQVERGGGVLGAVGPELVLSGGDVLRFVGNAHEVADLQERPGLEPAPQSPGSIPTGPMVFFEAVIGSGSVLVGSSLREVGFRERHDAAVLAIHRADHRLLGKLGDVQLRVGDTLLVLALPGFRHRWRGRGDFLLISRLDTVEPARSRKLIPASAVGLGVVVAAASGLLPILEASLLGGFGMLVLGVLSPDEARRAVDLSVIVLIAGSFGVAAAITKTGLASRLADGLVGGLEAAGTPMVLVGVALVTIALTEAVTNNAAAVLVFPIAIAVANDVGADPRAFAVVVALTASASFLTPIGYQTNTMVWGPGGYRFGDYARLGLPLTLAAVAVVGLVAPLWWSL